MSFDPFAHRDGIVSAPLRRVDLCRRCGLSQGAEHRDRSEDGMFGRMGPQARNGIAATMRMALIPAIWLGVLLLGAAGAQAGKGGGRVLTASDVVAIRIVDHPDLDWTARVEPDGTINVPYVGRIKAAGLTEDGLARMIERRLVELKIIAGP
jgi:Polysaccharide biosynthesis/export protein